MSHQCIGEVDPTRTQPLRRMPWRFRVSDAAKSLSSSTSRQNSNSL